ncbi:MAG TPA: DUF2298 domain-containing protein, partial [Anaerolineae bacterium]|nr:DUF2298 domain-containing protein [Anaerolineae bacterium]
ESRIPGLEGLVRAVPGAVRILLGRAGLASFDYWRSSRVIPQTINEFPYWSYLFADLHPHMIGIPVTIFLLALALNLALAARSDTSPEEGVVTEETRGGWKALRRAWWSVVGVAQESRLLSWENAAALVVVSVTLGAVAVINTWDVPAYMILLLGALLLGLRGFWRWQGALVALILFSLVGCLSLLLYLPFFTHYEALHVGIGVVRASTQLEPFLTIWGFLIFLAVSLLWARVVWGLPRETPLRGLSLLLRRGTRLPRLLDLHRLLVRAPRPGYTGGLLVLILTAFLCTALLLLKMWVLALLVPLLILFGLLVLRRKAALEDNFLVMLIFLAIGILLGCELVFVKDFLQGGDYYRMNTIFKFYTQAWVLLAVATGASLPLLWRRFAGIRRAPLRHAWQALCLFLLVSTAAFFFLGTCYRVDDRFPGPRPPLGTLDGSAFMTVGSYFWPDESNHIQLVYDHQAIDWFLENVKGTLVVAEAPLPYYREFGLKVASYTGLPTLLGAHQNEQRYDWQVGPRSDDANNLYRTTDLQEARQLISRMHVTYIYVGQLERSVYPTEGLEKFEELRTAGELALVYENPGVRVYEVLAR